MERLRNFLVQFYRHIVFILFSLVLLWLILLAGFGTAVIQTPSEENWLVSDSMAGNLVLALAAAAAAWLLLRRTSLRRLRERLNDAPPKGAAAGGGPGWQSSDGSCPAGDSGAVRTMSGNGIPPRGNTSGAFSHRSGWDGLRGEALFRRIRMRLLLAIGAVGIFLVLSLRVMPTADQSMILLCAQTLNKGDNTYLQLGQYLQGRQNQFGIVFLLQIYIRIFGEENYLPFQVFNVIGLVVIYYELSELGGMLHMSRFGRLVLIAFGIFFLPPALYTTFFYGTILGLAFSLAALRRAVLFDRRPAVTSEREESSTDSSLTFETYTEAGEPSAAQGIRSGASGVSESRSHVSEDLSVRRSHNGIPASFRHASWKDALLCAVYMAAACVLKSNYIIFLVGIVIYALIAFLRKKNPAQLGLVGMIVILYIGQSAGLDAYYNRYLEEPMADGMSSWSYVAMGLQECSYATDGWYNGYNTHSYEDSGYDTQVQAQMSLESIAERLAYFAENPGYAVRFFSVKVSSEWNDPLFQGEWIVATRESEIETATWTEVFSDARLRDGLVQIYNAVQFLLLFGVLMFVILSKDRGDHTALLLEMIFFGGFLFHLFWEAKAQYTLPYYMLLLPLSVQGYHCLLAAFDVVKEAVPEEIRRRSAAPAGQAGESAGSAAMATGSAEGESGKIRFAPAGAVVREETGSGRTAARGLNETEQSLKDSLIRVFQTQTSLLRRRETVLIAGFLALCLAFGLSDGKLSTYTVKLTDIENTYEEYLATYENEDVSMMEELASE